MVTSRLWMIPRGTVVYGVLVFFGGACHLYPAIRLPLCELGQSALGVPESLHCANPFFVREMVLAAKGLAALLAIPRLYKL